MKKMFEKIMGKDMGKLHDPRKLSETVIGELAQQIFI